MASPPDNLDLQAVRQANQQLWASHPELNRRQLTMGGDDTEYRKEWMGLYSQALAKKTAPPHPTVLPQPVPPPAPVTTNPSAQCPVAAMTHEQKMEEAIKMADLSPALKAAIGDPKTIAAALAISMGIMVGAGAAAAATGVGAIVEVAGAILLLGGAALAGYQIGSGITQLIDFYNKTRCDRAKTMADLKDASRDFASGVSNMGVGAFMLLLSMAGARDKGMLGEKLPDPSAAATRPSFVPKGWIEKPSKTGVKWVDPNNSYNQVRLEPAKPGSLNPGQQYDYMVVTKDGHTLDLNGNEVPRQSTESHIPQGTELPPDTFGPIE